MHGVIRWFRPPPLKFWLYGGTATVFLVAAIWDVVRGVGVELGSNPPPLLHGLRLGIGIVICVAVGAVLTWRAARAYRQAQLR
jgi:hypothetical protein